MLGLRLTSFKRGGGGEATVEFGNGLLNSGLFPQPYNLVTSWADLHFLKYCSLTYKAHLSQIVAVNVVHFFYFYPRYCPECLLR